jgi:hypothetical protein
MKDESSILLLTQFEGDRNGSCRKETIIADDVSPSVMLRLITYCYAKGVYGSGEIERKLRKSPVRQTAPDAKAIQRFRRYNRAALLMALERTLKLVAGEETANTIRREAEERLERAAISDMSLEE